MAIDITLMDELVIGTYTERAFKSCWYGLIEVWGQHIQTREQVIWKSEKWNCLKEKMIELFGEPDAPKISTEELVEFSKEYFNKDLDDLVEINRESFRKRQQFAARQNDKAA
ncbi:MAG: hypothetical protein HC815_05720 [Richelia sp. RM1_1_1]|nr:hypothetical protein [Richelia sp. RM1_1_1]